MSEALRLQLDPDDPDTQATIDFAKRVYGDDLEIVPAVDGQTGKMYKRVDGEWLETEPPHPGEVK